MNWRIGDLAILLNPQIEESEWLEEGMASDSSLKPIRGSNRE